MMGAGELADSTSRAQVFGFLPLVWAVGVAIGYVAHVGNMHDFHNCTTTLLQADHSHTRMKDSRPCSEIGSGNNIRTFCRACFAQFWFVLTRVFLEEVRGLVRDLVK